MTGLHAALAALVDELHDDNMEHRLRALLVEHPDAPKAITLHTGSHNPELSDRAGLSEAERDLENAVRARVAKYLETWKLYRGGRSLTSHAGQHLSLGDLRGIADLADRLAVVEQERTRQRDSLSAHADELASERNQALARAEAAEQEAATLRAQVAAVEALAAEWESGYPGPGASCNREVDEWWLDLRAALGDSAQVVQRIKDEAAAGALEAARDEVRGEGERIRTKLPPSPINALREEFGRGMEHAADLLDERARRVRDGGDHG